MRNAHVRDLTVGIFVFMNMAVDVIVFSDCFVVRICRILVLSLVRILVLF